MFISHHDHDHIMSHTYVMFISHHDHAHIMSHTYVMFISHHDHAHMHIISHTYVTHIYLTVVMYTRAAPCYSACFVFSVHVCCTHTYIDFAPHVIMSCFVIACLASHPFPHVTHILYMAVTRKQAV